MQRILRNTSSTLYETFYEDELATEADGTVTVTAVKPDGSTAFTVPATFNSADTSYRFNLPPQSALTILTLTWTGTFGGNLASLTSVVEIVGNRLFSIGDIRASNIALADTSKYSTDLIDLRRTEIEFEFEKITGTSFIPRYKRRAMPNPDPRDSLITVLARGGSDLYGWNPYRQYEAGYVSFDETGQTYFGYDEYGPEPVRDVWCEYEYGFTAVPPDVHREALNYARVLLMRPTSAIPDRATAFISGDGGTFTLATPGRNGYETGIPSVDAVLARYSDTGMVMY